VRTFEEIKADCDKAVLAGDASPLQMLTLELNALGTAEAEALAAFTDGFAMQLKGDYPRALAQYERAAVLYLEVGDRSGVARSYHSVGNVYAMTGDYPRALEQFERAMALHLELGTLAGASRVITSIGSVYLNTGSFPRALEQYDRGLALAQDAGALSSVAGITVNIGHVYQNTADYPRALENYERALVLSLEIGNHNNVAAMATGGIASVYEATGDYSRALEYLEKALALDVERRDKNGIAIVTGNIGNIYARSGDYRLAETQYERALLLHQELGDSDGSSRVSINLVQVLLALGEDKRAEAILTELESEVHSDPATAVRVKAARSQLQIKEGDLQSAYTTLLSALALCEEANLRSDSAFYHKEMRDLMQKLNDFEGYIYHNNEYQRVTEEIHGKEATHELAMMEAQREIQSERREREKERALLYGALPRSVADRKLRGEDVSGDHFDAVSVIFLDIVDFTVLSDRIPPGHVVFLLEQIFSALDDVCAVHGVTKIKTIGDSYMAVSGVPVPFEDHALRAAQTALDMLQTLKDLVITMPQELGDREWIKNVGEIQVRIGVHCGPVTAGVIGKDRLQYDLWGDTVNVASRMESSSTPGNINISADMQRALAPSPEFTFTSRGTIDVKGKGAMEMYFLSWSASTP